MDYMISPLTAERWSALEDLFGRAASNGNGYRCMYRHIRPRDHDRPRADNKRDLPLAAFGRSPGRLTFDGELAVECCELAPRAALRA
jgi:hypothetical protein